VSIALTTTDEYPETPELDKQAKIIDESRVLGCFLDWLNCEEISLVKGEDGWLGPRDYAQLLANYYEIDLKKVEAERGAVLDYVRRNQTVVSTDS
jgi:hypothetical protein